MKYIVKALTSLAILSIATFAKLWVSSNAYLLSGESAVHQFNNSDSAYTQNVLNQYIAQAMQSNFVIIFAVCVVLLLWKKEFMRLKEFFASLVLIVALLPSQDAQAYYSQQDWAEVYNVLPNHSAFMIPATGNNKDSQKQFESVDFLNEKKVGAKRIEIPHAKLPNSGALANYYVPTAILVLLDRTPYVVTWTKEKTNDSPANQEMCVETQDSVEICFDTSIGANVLEEDSAKYLYWFGTEPASGSEDEKKFPSVLMGKSLPNVMNTRVFSRIHAAYFAEFSKYSFKDMMIKKGEILTTVEKQMIDEYKKMGITIEYVGIASQFRFSKEIQDGINGVISAQYQQQAAASKLEALKVARYEAETQIMLAQVEPYKKWDGKSFPNVPQFLIGAEPIVNWLKDIFKK